jgi:hypothetical protein
MTDYTLSYWIKQSGGGWQYIRETFSADSLEAAKDYAKTKIFPIGSMLHTLELDEAATAYVPTSTPKRKAAWKQNPLARFAARGNT